MENAIPDNGPSILSQFPSYWSAVIDHSWICEDRIRAIDLHGWAALIATSKSHLSLETKHFSSKDGRCNQERNGHWSSYDWIILTVWLDAFTWQTALGFLAISTVNMHVSEWIGIRASHSPPIPQWMVHFYLSMQCTEMQCEFAVTTAIAEAANTELYCHL